MIPLQTSYLNRTPHKTPRTTPLKPVFVVLHETAGFGTLEWNIKPEARASFNYLILRNGVIHWYVDERNFIAWHAGVGPLGTVNGIRYDGLSRWTVNTKEYWGTINTFALGVEFEGMNDGTPITAAQTASFIELAIHFYDTYGIPIADMYYPEHKDIAPQYKTDGRGYDAKALITMAAAAAQAMQSDDRGVIGVVPSCTTKQYIDSLTRNTAPFSQSEMQRGYILLQWNDIDPAYAIAMMKRESEFGKNPLQQITKNLFNIKAESGDDRTRYKDDKGVSWLAYESPWIALQDWIVHMKQEYGAKGLRTVRQIIPVYAPSFENNTETYITNVLLDMRWIREH